jgi:fatty-acyl-CoA synthase
LPSDEWNAIALNYTSGTTGNPKGVVTHHRGAYLNAVSNVVTWAMPLHPVYLWTLPMFHCNGWCFPWTMALQAGASVCLRKVAPALIFELIREHRVTHLCGAPIVYGMLINSPEKQRAGITHAIRGLIAGSAPPAAIIEGCERIGIEITHVYGLTEVYGPARCVPSRPNGKRCRWVSARGLMPARAWPIRCSRLSLCSIPKRCDPYRLTVRRWARSSSVATL